MLLRWLELKILKTYSPLTLINDFVRKQMNVVKPRDCLSIDFRGRKRTCSHVTTGSEWVGAFICTFRDCRE